MKLRLVEGSSWDEVEISDESHIEVSKHIKEMKDEWR
jgi:hypothetical protein